MTIEDALEQVMIHGNSYAGSYAQVALEMLECQQFDPDITDADIECQLLYVLSNIGPSKKLAEAKQVIKYWKLEH